MYKFGVVTRLEDIGSLARAGGYINDSSAMLRGLGMLNVLFLKKDVSYLNVRFHFRFDKR